MNHWWVLWPVLMWGLTLCLNLLGSLVIAPVLSKKKKIKASVKLLRYGSQLFCQWCFCPHKTYLHAKKINKTRHQVVKILLFDTWKHHLNSPVWVAVSSMSITLADIFLGLATCQTEGCKEGQSHDQWVLLMLKWIVKLNFFQGLITRNIWMLSLFSIGQV